MPTFQFDVRIYNADDSALPGSADGHGTVEVTARSEYEARRDWLRWIHANELFAEHVELVGVLES